ncbi:MAG: hypothetical protein ACRCUY_04865 [Thermoguttaceae bacterium]
MNTSGVQERIPMGTEIGNISLAIIIIETIIQGDPPNTPPTCAGGSPNKPAKYTRQIHPPTNVGGSPNKLAKREREYCIVKNLKP